MAIVSRHRCPRSGGAQAGSVWIGLALISGPFLTEYVEMRPGPETAAGRSAQERAAVDFEAFPDGRPACERCPVSEEFRSLGLVFSFDSRFTGPGPAYLIASGAYDPPEESENHAVTAALTQEGFRPGRLVLSLPTGPRRVELRLRGSAVVSRFAIRAWARDGGRLAPGGIVQRPVRTYRASRGGRFREIAVEVESPRGIARIEFDGRGPPGHILLVDDVRIER